jgi:hypothetical protein
MNGFREGKKLSQANINRRINTFNNKCEEYDKLSLQELKDLYPSLSGSYKFACETIVQRKLDKEREILTDISSKELNKEKLDE